jgi:hypothetical protein
MTPCFVSPVFSVSFQLVRERCQVSTRSWQDAVDKTVQLALLSVRPLVVRYRRVNRDSAHNLVSRMRLSILVTTAVKRALNPRPTYFEGQTWCQVAVTSTSVHR